MKPLKLSDIRATAFIFVRPGYIGVIPVYAAMRPTLGRGFFSASQRS